MQSQRLAVLTICRNDLEGLKHTVASVASQTRAPDEFLVLDGGSQDGTVEYLQGCPDVTAWKSEPDQGIADAFNKVAATASADWVVFLNGGDAFVDPRVLEDMAAVLDSLPPETGVCYGDALVVDPQGLRPARRLVGSHEFGRGDNPLCHQAAFLRRTLQQAHPYDGRLRIGMDYDLWLRLLPVTGFRHVDRTVCDYRLGGISSSREWAEHSIVAHRMVEWINRRGSKLGWSDALGLVRELAAFRAKKLAEALLGRRLYGMLRERSR